MQVFGIISMILFALCFIPQIARILRTKKVEGISLVMWLVVAAGHATGLIYVASIKKFILILTYSMGLILSLFTTFLVIKYRIKAKKS